MICHFTINIMDWWLSFNVSLFGSKEFHSTSNGNTSSFHNWFNILLTVHSLSIGVPSVSFQIINHIIPATTFNHGVSISFWHQLWYNTAHVPSFPSMPLIQTNIVQSFTVSKRCWNKWFIRLCQTLHAGKLYLYICEKTLSSHFSSKAGRGSDILGHQSMSSNDIADLSGSIGYMLTIIQ